MIEPVAYRYRMSEHEAWQYLACKPSENFHWRYVEPLYTAEQLHPRVKMTQAEFDEFKSMPVFASVYGAMITLYSGTGTRYNLLLKRFSGSDGQAELARLWFDYRIKNKSREETIEIVPEKKWFVRSKETIRMEEDTCYSWLIDISELNPEYALFEWCEEAHKFDTKEEAEKWTNPLTEAVQLPVEE